MHPQPQRELIELLVAETSNQYLITTHSPTLINAFSTNPNITLFHLQYQDSATIGGPAQNERASVQAARDLGLKPSDLMQANCILWIEGLSDRVYIQRWLELLAPELLEGRDYMFMCYSSLPHLNIELDIFSNELINVLKFNPNAIIIMDSDKTKDDDEISKTKKEMKEQCEKNGGVSWVTDGKEIENYLSERTYINFA